MKGNEKLISTLNFLLADELTAINQYMVHAEMADNWGYERLHELVEKRAFAEMRHAEKLIARILFLDAQPIVSELREIRIGADVPKQFDNDLGLEISAIKRYNEAIALAQQVADNATKELLESILKDEDGHMDEIEENQDQIKQMGIQTYLNVQVKK